MNQMAVFQALLRSDFYTFVQRVFREVVPGEEFIGAPHIEAMCYALAEAGRKRRRRQLIEVPPRSLKSICASVALVAWLLGHDPTLKIICVSYSQDLADRFSAMTRQVMKSAWYRASFPKTAVSPDKDTERYFRTTAGGYRSATSVGGTITGTGAGLIVIDDPGKPDDMMSEALRTKVNEWYDRTLSSRLNNKARDGIIIVMQRLHMDDLVGHVRRHGAWDALTIPAIAIEPQRLQLGPDRWHERHESDVLDLEREPRHVLDELKIQLGSRAFSSQYQQDPLPEDGGVIDWRWFGAYDERPPRGAVRVVMSWDCASKDTEFADYSVCTVWAVLGFQYYLLTVIRRKLNFPDLLDTAIREAERWRPDEILIEDAAAGIQLADLLRFQCNPSVPTPMRIKAEKDKVTRVHTVSHVIEQGRVLLPLEAPWLDDLKAEVLQFPHGKHDDQIDSMSQFLAREERRRIAGPSVEVVSMFGPREPKPKLSRPQEW